MAAAAAPLRRLCCPVAFVAGTWALSTQVGRLSLESAWPHIGSDWQWAILSDIYVGVSFILGFPPEAPPRAADGPGEGGQTPLEMLEDVFREAGNRRTRYDIVFSTVFLVFLACPMVFMWYKVVMAVVSGPVRKSLVNPAWKRLANFGLSEPLVYALSFVVCALGVRVAPIGEPAPGVAAAIAATGALMFTSCWWYTVTVHKFAQVERPSGDSTSAEVLVWRKATLRKRSVMRVFGLALQALVFVPLAVALSSRLLGFFAVGAIYLAAVLDLFSKQFGQGSFLWQCEHLLSHISKVASRLSISAATASFVGGRLGASWVAPFSIGACCFGHCCFFLAEIALSSSEWPAMAFAVEFRHRQSRVLLSIAAAAVLGWGFGVEALKSSSVIFTLLWLLLKEMEVHLKTKGSLQTALKWAAGLIILWYLISNSGQVLSLFDPSGLYA